MRVASAIVVLLAIPAALASPLQQIGFEGPAQLEGPEFSATGSWAFIVFAQPNSATIEAKTSSPAKAAHHESLFRETNVPPLLDSRDREDLPPGDPEPVGPFQFQATPLGWAGLYLHAADLTLLANGNRSSLDAYPTNYCTGLFLDHDHSIHSLFRRGHCTSTDHVFLKLSVADGPIEISLAAAALRSLEMFNFEVSCAPGREPECPTGGGPTNLASQSVGPATTHLYTHRYDELILAGGTAHITGVAAMVVIGGERMNVTASGGGRLPGVDDETCRQLGCTLEDRPTLRFPGAVALTDLRMNSGSHNLHAVVQTDANSAILDEAVIGWAPDATAAAVATGLLAALAIGIKAMVGVLGQSSSKRTLAHPNRRRLFDFIQSTPGATFREVVRETGIPSGTARHHIQVMCQAGVIIERQHRSTLRYFDAKGDYADSWNTTVILREPDLARLHGWMLANPGVYQKDVVDAAGGWGWSRSTTQHRLSRLVDEGLGIMTLQGRLKRYHAVSHAPLPSARPSGAHGSAASQVA